MMMRDRRFRLFMFGTLESSLDCQLHVVVVIIEHMLFPVAGAVDDGVVEKLVAKHWPQFDGEQVVLLKKSQNCTYGVGSQAVLRVTPRDRLALTKAEETMLLFMSAHGLNVCEPLPNGVVFDQGMTLMLMRKTRGRPVDYVSWEWMRNERMVRSVGVWLARFHNLARQLPKEVVSSFPHWYKLHCNIMENHPAIDARDLATIDDASQYGLCHGDINPTNFFYVDDVTGKDSASIDVFDWDQCSRGHFLYDLAQPIIGVRMVAIGGSPIDYQPVDTNEAQYTKWIVEGYESATDQPVTIDREKLERMVVLRGAFYRTFCMRAVAELSENCPAELEHMLKFCKHIVNSAL
jgi:Ser/Thr protein kinase RdoA (MazF antagonist)